MRHRFPRCAAVAVVVLVTGCVGFKGSSPDLPHPRAYPIPHTPPDNMLVSREHDTRLERGLRNLMLSLPLSTMTFFGIPILP